MLWVNQKINIKEPLTAKDVLLSLAFVASQGMTDILEYRKRLAESIHPGLIDPEYETWRSKQLKARFLKQQYIELKKDRHGEVTIVITKKGMRRAYTYNVEAMKIKVTKWDKKWRVVTFDIPVRFGKIRHIFRMRLLQLGLFKLQESVYVSPYPCFDEIEFLRELYDVSFTVRYLVAEKIEDDELLRRHFHLK